MTTDEKRNTNPDHQTHGAGSKRKDTVRSGFTPSMPDAGKGKTSKSHDEASAGGAPIDPADEAFIEENKDKPKP